LDLHLGGLNSKSEARIAKQIRMNEDESPKRFDLEERTFAFAKRVREFVKELSKTIGNVEDSRQLSDLRGLSVRTTSKPMNR